MGFSHPPHGHDQIKGGPFRPHLAVFERDGAAFFEKTHKDVLEAIDNLLKSLVAEKSATLFIKQLAFDERANRETRSFDMSRDGFALLAMGFTGAKALTFKLAYIERFNAMEDSIKTMGKELDRLIRSSGMAEMISASAGNPVHVQELMRLTGQHSRTSSVPLPNQRAFSRAQFRTHLSRHPAHAPV